MGEPTRRDRLLVACGIVSALIGVSLLSEWRRHVQGRELTAASGSLLAGAGLIAIGFHRLRASLAFGLVTLAIGLFELTAYGLVRLNSNDPFALPGQDPSRLPPSCSFGFLAAGAALSLAAAPAYMRRLRSIGCFAACCATAAGIAAAAVHATAVSDFAGDAAPLPCVFGFLVIGIPLAAVHWPARGGGRMHRLAPVVVSVALISATMYLWYAQRTSDAVRRKKAAEIAASHVSGYLVSEAGLRGYRLSQLAARWRTSGARLAPAWQADASEYLAGPDRFEAVVWLGADKRIQWASDGAAAPQEEMRAVAARAADLRRTALSDAFTTPDGSRQLAFAVPVIRGNAVQGYLVGVLTMQDLLGPVAQSSMPLDLVISDRTGILFDSSGEADQPGWQPEFGIAMPGAEWRGRVRASMQGGEDQWPSLATVTLALGFIITTLFWAASDFAYEARSRAHQAEASNRELEAEIEVRKRAEAELAQARRDLENRVEARTAELETALGSLRAEMTERLKAEETLRASEEKYRELFDNANDLVFATDLQGRCVSVNKAALRILGRTREEVIGRKLSEIVEPGDPAFEPLVAGKLGGEGPSTNEVPVRTKDGRRLILEVNTRLLFEGGRPAGVQGIARDITVRRRLEQQLHQSQKMDAIGRLAGGVAHDFNNILTVISACGELLRETLPAEHPSMEFVRDILSASRRASALTSRLLAVSRRQVMKPRVFCVNNLVRNLHPILQRLIGEDVELRAALGEDTGCVRADPAQIEQVLLNLVVNAREAMPSGGRATIETSCCAREGSARWVKLTVSDTGCGMDAETASHIFEPFFTTKKSGKGKGTGLGLSIVYGIVQQSGGSISVESEPGRGASFTILLPWAAAEEPAEAAGAAEPAAVTPVSGAVILLAEDERELRSLIHRMLTNRGYEVIDASDGEEALERWRRHSQTINLLLTDVVMPRLGGKGLAERIRRERPDLPVLFMTGYSEELVGDSGDGVLRKPFPPESLYREVRSRLEPPAAPPVR